ncbi:hypothetical protein MVEN_01180700 [Mycena venus]|uniref:Cytochrome P450 n=1 Tax=Mycena venus TaxID=2733690 RepID=A0A8H6Y5R8_9AGAR|nr:hypothetical protein MVEN_01180700 [Mycena venus]
MLSPAFSFDSVKEMTSVIYECAERLETRLTNLIRLDSALEKNGTGLNIVPYIGACTLNIIGAVALSHSFSAHSALLKPLAFLAPIVLCAIPQAAVARAPLPLMQSQGVIKTIVRRIGRKILDREKFAVDKASKGILTSINPENSCDSTLHRRKQRIGLLHDLLPLLTSLPGIGAIFRITKGQLIHIPFTPMHTNPRVWGPTAAVFDPLRWLEVRDPAILPHGWSGLLAFCEGPRNCLAVLELKIILVTLVRSFVFTDTGVHVDEKISPTLQPVVDGG